MSKSYYSLFNEFDENLQKECRDLFENYLNNPQISANALADEFNNLTGLKIDRKKVANLMKQLGFPKRDPEIVRQSRILLGRQALNTSTKNKIENLESKINVDELIKKYKSGVSLESISKSTGTSTYFLTKIFTKNGFTVNKTVTYNDIYEKIVNAGITNQKIVELITNESQEYTRNYLSKLINENITETSFRRMLAMKVSSTYYLSLEELINYLDENGFDKDRIIDIYSQHKSKLETVKVINKELNENAINRSSLTKVMNFYNIQTRAFKATQTYGKGYTAEELINLYQSERISLQKMYEKYGISPVTLSKLAKERGIDVSTQRTIKDLLILLNDKGVSREKIKSLYIQNNLTSRQMTKWLNEILEGEDFISERTFQKLVIELDMNKTKELISENRGKKSRRELLKNLEKLKKAGFDSREDLAQYYEDNLSLSKPRLVRQLNESLGEDFFTVRWLERHMDPLLSVDRLKGTSRVEREFAEILYLHLPKGTQVELNNNSIIAPLL